MKFLAFNRTTDEDRQIDTAANFFHFAGQGIVGYENFE